MSFATFKVTGMTCRYCEAAVIADSSRETYTSVLRNHIHPALGGKKLNTVRRQDIKNLVASMSADGIGASRVHAAHLVINAIFNEAVRDKKLAESPCADIELHAGMRPADRRGACSQHPVPRGGRADSASH